MRKDAHAVTLESISTMKLVGLIFALLSSILIASIVQGSDLLSNGYKVLINNDQMLKHPTELREFSLIELDNNMQVLCIHDKQLQQVNQ